MLRRMAVMALALGGLSMPARAEDAIRLFAPVPAGKIVLMPPANRTAYSPPRALIVRAAPLMRGSLKDGETVAPSSAPTINAPWQVAPRGTIQRKTATSEPSTAQWQTAGAGTNAVR